MICCKLCCELKCIFKQVGQIMRYSGVISYIGTLIIQHTEFYVPTSFSAVIFSQ